MKKILTLLLALSMLASVLAGCAASAADNGAETSTLSATTGSTTDKSETTAPKYVFLFIGDGMSYPQIQSTSDFLGALEDKDYWQAQPSLDDNKGAILDGPQYLNFMNFEAAGSAVTYDSNSFCPDSASTATSISTGHKTYSGTINMSEDYKTAYETIAEKVHQQLGMKVGVISSVNLNHATPAAFYAHQASRNDYYEIGLELIESGFEYFSGGALLKPTGSDGDQKDLYTLAEEAGYTVVKTQAEAQKVTEGPVIIVDEHLADGDAMAYELDRTDDMWSLADHVEKGIEVLDNDKGFFMMCEGGKIDWACHANDAGSTVADTVALADAVQVAVDFAKEHPNDTLILVTGDHETGGLSIGFAGTDYDTYLTNLASQKISYAKFDEEYVAAYKANKTPFETAMKDVEELFGLNLPTGGAGNRLTLTSYEIQRLKDAYQLAMTDYDSDDYTQEQYVLYGTYNPFSVTITHILNNKSGVDFTSYSHTGLPVAVFADGVGADAFGGYYDNTQIYDKLATMLKVK